MNPQKSSRRKASNPTAATSRQQRKAMAPPSKEQVALRAYFIAEHRRSLELSGDETSDWVQAERELLEELRAK
jgi:hypothetical protein